MKRALVATGLVLGLALLASPARAQTGTARGKVLDAEGKPLVDAKVLIEYQGGINRKFETKSNKKGEWMQVGLQPGPYRFTASKEGYQTSVVEYRISLGDPTQVPDFKLSTHAQAASQPGETADQLRKSFQAAVELQSAGKLDEAEAAYKAIAEKEPDVPEVYQNLGSIYMTRKDYPAAEAAYQKALDLRPTSSDIAAALARVYMAAGQPDKATAVIDKVAAANPADAQAQYNRGIYLLNQNQSEEATKAFEAAVKADPNLAEAYFRLGTLMVGQNKVPEAVQYLEKYLSLNPTDAQNVATAKGLIAALKK